MKYVWEAMIESDLRTETFFIVAKDIEEAVRKAEKVAERRSKKDFFDWKVVKVVKLGELHA